MAAPGVALRFTPWRAVSYAAQRSSDNSTFHPSPDGALGGWVAEIPSSMEMIEWRGFCDQAVLVMFEFLWTVLIYPRSLLRSQHELAMEVLALRHQITVLKRVTGSNFASRLHFAQ